MYVSPKPNGVEQSVQVAEIVGSRAYVMKTGHVVPRGFSHHRIATGDCRRTAPTTMLIAVCLGLCSLLAPAQSFNSDLQTWEPLANWTLRHQVTDPAPHNLRGVAGVAFGNGQFVVVARSGAIATTSDGRNWTRPVVETGDLASLAGVAFGSDRFITVGRGGMVSSSTDGRTWSASQGDPSWYFHGVRFVNGRFIAFSRPGLIHISEK